MTSKLSNQKEGNYILIIKRICEIYFSFFLGNIVDVASTGPVGRRLHACYCGNVVVWSQCAIAILCRRRNRAHPQ